MGPTRLHAASHRTSRLVRLPNDVGMGPVSRNVLYARRSSLRVEMLPREEGNVPLRRLLTRERNSSRRKLPKVAGMWPEKLLRERSRL